MWCVERGAWSVERGACRGKDVERVWSAWGVHRVMGVKDVPSEGGNHRSFRQSSETVSGRQGCLQCTKLRSCPATVQATATGT